MPKFSRNAIVSSPGATPISDVDGREPAGSTNMKAALSIGEIR